ncbi:hypothetical protein HK097_000666 [Rhizophlyctis rosea]|uniref:Glycerol-3-phosphate dehydrogenase [NAD(+)] n=1 Tax=Rhizophlyctis rosea TaxID=64517 RepID=A0AAD5S6H3_9FUNG|nr:hypothetical protein HK097_000666 [Rhizophlyctis rosea]
MGGILDKMYVGADTAQESCPPGADCGNPADAKVPKSETPSSPPDLPQPIPRTTAHIIPPITDDLPRGGEPEGGDSKVVVFGAGNFGTCLADHLADIGNRVTIWARDNAVVQSINENHRNLKYMKDVELSSNINATLTIDASLLLSVTVAIFSIPTQNMRSVLEHVKPFLRPDHLLIFVNKGIEISTGLLPSDIAIDVLGMEMGARAVFMSGPSFAIEIVKRQPTGVTVASSSRARAHRTQRLFHTPHFRVYDVPDVVGVEVAGALKNVIAIASGACTGMGFQMNTRAAVITRGLAEIARFGVAMGAQPITFAGLAGVGDLFLTCTSEKSRNFTVGYRMGKGETLDEITKTLGSVAEGVGTTEAAWELAKKLDVDAPLCDAVHSVLYRGVKVEDAIRKLMGREAAPEMRGIVE